MSPAIGRYTHLQYLHGLRPFPGIHVVLDSNIRCSNISMLSCIPCWKIEGHLFKHLLNRADQSAATSIRMDHVTYEQEELQGLHNV